MNYFSFQMADSTYKDSDNTTFSATTGQKLDPNTLMKKRMFEALQTNTIPRTSSRNIFFRSKALIPVLACLWDPIHRKGEG